MEQKSGAYLLMILNLSKYNWKLFRSFFLYYFFMRQHGECSCNALFFANIC